MHTDLFHEIYDSFAILIKGGIARQVPLYHRGDRLYAKFGGGFARLSKTGTSVPNLVLDGLECSEKLEVDGVGWYVYVPGKTPAKLKAV